MVRAGAGVVNAPIRASTSSNGLVTSPCCFASRDDRAEADGRREAR